MDRAPVANLRAEAEALLDRHLLMVRGYLRHLLSSPADAEDVAQEVCVTVLGDPRILLRGADPGAYLRGICRHLASRHHRAARRPAALEDLFDSVWGGPSDENAERVHQALGSCLERAPERVRQLLDWRYRDGLDSRQIAERATTSREAIRMALMRARQALARCLSERLGDARLAPDGGAQ